MANHKIEHPLRVFISSKCGGKYTIARKALKSLLCATGLFEIYAFETEPASSIDTQSGYLEYVEQSNLCVFIVDNADNVSSAVLSEIKTARDRRIRQIYVFCDEQEKDPTPLQNEIMEALSHKYVIVHDFSDVVDVAYISVMQDILAVYKRKDRVDSIEEGDEKLRGSLTEHRYYERFQAFEIPHNSNVISKHVADTLKEDIIGVGKSNSEEIPDLNMKIAEYLRFALGKKPFNINDLMELKELIVRSANEIIKPVLMLRFDSLTFFFSGNYEKCLEVLQNALSVVVADCSLPSWIALDIAVDIRYVCWKEDEINNRFSFDNAGQKFIDESLEPVYYPYMDRQGESFYQKISQRYYKVLNKPPQQIEFGGIEEIFAELSNMFYIAVLHGSLLHTILIRSRLIDCLSMLTTLYSDHEYMRELLRLSIINADTKAIDGILRSNCITEEKLNYTDIRRFADCLDFVTDQYLKRKGQFCLISKFGYYMEDNYFEELFNELYAFSLEWVEDDAAIVNLGASIFDFFKGTVYRADQEKVVRFIAAVFRNGYSRYYIDALKLIQELDISNMPKELQRLLRDLFYDLMKGKYLFSIDNYTYNTFIVYARKTTIPFKKVEDLFYKKTSQYYKNSYDLELATKKGRDISEFIPIYLNIAKERDEEQGIEGKHIGYAFEPHSVIYNILKYSNKEFTTEETTKIMQSAFSTLARESQTVQAKKSAIRLLQFIYFNTQNQEICDEMCQRLAQNETVYTTGYSMWAYNDDNTFDLILAYNLLCSVFVTNKTNKVINMICSVDINDKSVLLFTLIAVKHFLADANQEQVNNNLLVSLLNFSLIMAQNKEKEVRLSATKCLVELSRYKTTSDLALMGMSRIIDDGTFEEKTYILASFKEVSNHLNPYREQIIKKGLADSHYLVRLVAGKAK